MDDSDLDTLLAKLAATPRKRPPVQVFSGTRRYELRRRLGRGAFGDVYEARDREHGALVALKALRTSQPEWIYRFKREFRIGGELSHPNIVRLFELFCEDERWYLTMELVDGLPFDEYVLRSPDHLRVSFTQLARGLVALHGSGCLHRDVKPSNALVERTGRVVLLDFGLTLDQHGALHTAVAGTPPFMAPELAMGARPGEASDWYSFGVMLYAALAGELPFRGSRSEIFAKKLANTPARPTALRPGVDPALEALALRLLAPVPADRPSGDEILAELAGSPLRRSKRAADPEGAVVGRDRELALLDRALAAVAAGTATAVTVHGDPGMGKTTLLRAFVARCRQAKALILVGRCHETESVPYKGLDGAIDMLCAELSARPQADVADVVPHDADALVQMFPVLKRVPAFARARREQRVRAPQDARRRASRGLRELLQHASEGAPVMLMIDDVHWASDDGVQLLVELMAAPPPPILLLVAYRPQEPGAVPILDRLLAALDGASMNRVDVPVGPLDEDGVAGFLAAHGATSVPAARAVVETGGHPFLLTRLVENHTWSKPRHVDVGEMLADEIAALDGPVRDLLEVVALAALPLTERAAFAALGAAPDPRVVDDLRRSRLVQRRGGAEDGQLEVYHDRVRETVVEYMPADRRRALHLRIAEMLERRGRMEPEALAHHYRHGGDRERALDWTRRAARAASSSLAFARAAELLSEAIALADDDRARLELLEQLADARVQTGRRGEGGETCLQAADLAATLGDTAAHARLRTRAGQHFLLGGYFERGFELVGAVLAEVGVELPPTPPLAVAHSFNLGAGLATRGLEFERRSADQVDPASLRRIDLSLEVASALTLTDIRGPWIATRALLDALAAGEPLRVQRALAFFALNNSARAPDHPLVVEALAQALRLGEELGDELGLAWTHLADGMHALQRTDFVRALERCRDAERRFLALGSVHAREAALARIAVSIICGTLGLNLPWASAVAPELLEEALARGDLFAANWTRQLICWTELVADDPTAARGHVADARRTWPRMADSLFAATSLTNEIAIELYDNPAGAWAQVERITPDFRQMYSSIIATPRSVYDRLASAAALAAYNAGLADRDTTMARIEPLARDIERLDYAEATRFLLRSYLRALAGDRLGYESMLERCRQAWAHTRQRVHELTAIYRLCEVRGDEAGRLAAAEELRSLTVVDPERYVIVYAGPLPSFPR